MVRVHTDLAAPSELRAHPGPLGRRIRNRLLVGIQHPAHAYRRFERRCRALGSYAPPPKARGILADTNAGPMGVAAIMFSVAAQIIGVHAIMQGAGSTTLSDVGHFPASDFPVSTVIGLILVPTVARISALILCTEGYRPANPTGFGALVIGTVPKLGTAAWVTTAAIAAFVGGGILWTLMTLAVIALTIPWALHCSRRFDGLAGDCLGATIEIATAATVVLFSLTA